MPAKAGFFVEELDGRTRTGKCRERQLNTSQDQADAIEYYVSGEGMWINQYLRGRGDFGELNDFEKKFLKDLDTATNKDIGKRTLYRSVDATAIFGNMDDYEYDNMRNVIVNGQNAFGKGAYAQSLVDAVNRRVKSAIGKTITEKGFMSTTKSQSVAEQWGDFTGSSRPITLKINTSKSTKGRDVSALDKKADSEQQEVLLRRGQSYTVNKVSKGRNNGIFIEVTMR